MKSQEFIINLKPHVCIINLWRNWNMVETSWGSLVTIFLKSLKSKVGSQIIRDSRPRKCKTTL